MRQSGLRLSLLLPVAILVLNVGVASAAGPTYSLTAKVVSANSGGSATQPITPSVTGSWTIKLTGITGKVSWAFVAVWTPVCYAPGTNLMGFKFNHPKVGQTFTTSSLNAGTSYCIELTDGGSTGATVTVLVTTPG